MSREPCPFERRHCPNPRCRSRIEHAMQTVWFKGCDAPAVGWCCANCGHVHVDAPQPVEAVP